MEEALKRVDDKHYFVRFEETIVNYWDRVAMTDLGGVANYTFKDIAVNIEKLQLLFDVMGIQRGDKIAICGKNCANWAICYLASTLYGGVIVSILPDFTISSIHELVNHSEARVMFVSTSIQNGLDYKKLPNVDIVLSIQDFSVVFSRKSLEEVDIEALFKEKHPNGFTAADVHYFSDNWDELAIINYTSGSSGNPKGVMLTHRNLSSNVTFGEEHMANSPADTVVSMLPLAHMFGMMFEFLYQLAGGAHIYFMTRTPTPTVLLEAFATVKPYMVLTVPLVIEKIIRSKVFPVIRKPYMRILWYTPIVSSILRRKVRQKLLAAFGNRLRTLIIGGAALNRHVEKCLKQIHFPYNCGYGMTECGPLICYEENDKYVKGSCGKVVDRMELKIDSEDPHHVPGEVLVRGDNVMRGYYKNTVMTDSVFTDDGWMRTGDVGVMDKKGNLFLRGRSKNIILGANGQNIYPEEIEDMLNVLEGVEESIVVGRGGKLIGLIYPQDKDVLTSDEKMAQYMEKMQESLKKLNKTLPVYANISKFEVMREEFQKTPKKSIKRFLYK